MSTQNPTLRLACALSVIIAVASLSACQRPAQKKLPVCPGDPRCEKLLY